MDNVCVPMQANMLLLNRGWLDTDIIFYTDKRLLMKDYLKKS